MRCLSLIIGAAALSGCASFGPKFDAERADKVKKVAVLSIEIQQEQPTDALGFSKIGELKNGKATEGVEYQAMSRDIYNDFVTRLAKKTGWQVVGFETLTTNPEYAKVWKDKMTGFRSVTYTGSDKYELVELKGVLGNAPFRRLSTDEKVKLAKAVGADAYAELMIFQNIDQKGGLGNLTGDAPFFFTSRANLMVFGLDGEEPIWRIQNVDGAISPPSDSLPSSASKVDRLTKIGGASAKSSIVKLLDTYKR